MGDDDDSDSPFVDNFDNIHSDHENEPGIPLKKPPSSNSNDSDIGLDLINDTEREIIRQNEREITERESVYDDERDHNHNRDRDHEPGSISSQEFPEGINSNVDLIQYEESQRNRKKDRENSRDSMSNDDDND